MGVQRDDRAQQDEPARTRGHWLTIPPSGMNLELSDEETEALLKELNDIIDGDRYQFSARVRMLKAIRAKIRPEPVREPLPPPPKQYAPPRATAAKRRRH
jgi:hypothetical protein